TAISPRFATRTFENIGGAEGSTLFGGAHRGRDAAVADSLRRVEREPFDPAEFEAMAGAVSWIRRIVCHAEIDSTNAEALRVAAAGEPDGFVVVADSQTGGRGRLGRSWWAEPGAALLVSWLLRPALEPERRPLLSLVAGVAAARAASAAGGVDVRLKWP